MLRSHISSRRRGGVHCRFDRKTTPSSRKADASRYFLDRAATPPCGDARRGICLTDNSRLIWTVLPRRRGHSLLHTACFTQPASHSLLHTACFTQPASTACFH